MISEARERGLPRTPTLGSTLYRSLLRELLLPTLLSLGGLTLVVLLKDLLGYADLIINRGLGAGAVIAITLLRALPIVTEMLPFSVIVGSLVALGRLGADRELLALEAAGIAPRRLVGPIATFAGLATVVALGLSLWGSPRALRALDAAVLRIATVNPAAALRAGVVHSFGAWKLEALEVSPSGRSMQGVSLWLPKLGATVFAARGELRSLADGARELELRDGASITRGGAEPRRIGFGSMRTRVPAARDTGLDLEIGEALERMGPFELEEEGHRQEVSRVRRRQARMLLHERVALPLAALLFGVAALPLALRRGVHSRSGGAMLGVLVVAAYYGLVQLGYGLSRAGQSSPALAAWLPDAAFAAGVALLFVGLDRVSSHPSSRDRTVGRQMAAILERLRPDRGESAASASPGPRPGSQPVGREIRVHRMALARYVLRRFATLTALVFVALLAGYLLVDVLERLQWFAKYGATADEAVRFYGLRIPLLASRVVPMSLLVATSLTVGWLAVQGELVGIRASGIPVPKALLPILYLCIAVVPAVFFLNDDIVPRTNSLADRLKDQEIKERSTPSPDELVVKERRRPVWRRSGRSHVEAHFLDPQLGEARALTIYELGADGMPQRRLDAEAARHVGDGNWRLVGAQAVEIGPQGPRPVAAPEFVALGDAVQAEVDTMHLSIAELEREIAHVEEAGLDPRVYQVDYQAKLAAPLACLVLPAIALFFCISGPPYPSSARSLMASAGAVAAYALLSGVSASLGYAGVLTPVAAGWAPTALFAGGAAGLAWRLRHAL